MSNDLFKKMEEVSTTRIVFLEKVNAELRKIQEFLQVHPHLHFKDENYTYGVFKAPKKYRLARIDNLKEKTLPVMELPLTDRIKAWEVLTEGVFNYFDNQEKDGEIGSDKEDTKEGNDG